MKKILLILVICLPLLLTACGSSRPTTAIKVNVTDFAYNPNEFIVPAGQEITVEITNNGAVVHNFIIMKAGASIGKDFDEEDAANEYWKVEIMPGQSTTASFTAPSAPGEHLIVCSTPGHYIAGMTGKLVVVSE